MSVAMPEGTSKPTDPWEQREFSPVRQRGICVDVYLGAQRKPAALSNMVKRLFCGLLSLEDTARGVRASFVAVRRSACARCSAHGRGDVRRDRIQELPFLELHTLTRWIAYHAVKAGLLAPRILPEKLPANSSPKGQRLCQSQDCCRRRCFWISRPGSCLAARSEARVTTALSPRLREKGQRRRGCRAE